jgi:uncharacterized protein YodC (DUF2158 family)
MATTFTKNQTVRLKAVVPQGEVEALRMDENGDVSYRISWTDANGNSQTRWFTENELEAV